MFGWQRTEEWRLHNGAFVASSKLLDDGAAFLRSYAAMAPDAGAAGLQYNERRNGRRGSLHYMMERLGRLLGGRGCNNFRMHCARIGAGRSRLQNGVLQTGRKGKPRKAGFAIDFRP